ncbi:MAG: baseplate J/gp47 family protein [Nannocystaceae bacterium]
MAFGLTDEGFSPKPLSEILSDINAGWIDILGPNADVDPDTVDGQIIGLFAGMFDEGWQTASENVSQFDPQNARGVLLSKLVQLNGLLRKDEEFTAVVAEVVGTAAATLPAGSIASTTADDRFILQASVVFTGGSDSSSWLAEEPGPIPCDAATLTVITTPVSGWTSVNNAAGATQIGSLEESDGDLRRRREVSTELGAVNTETAIQAAVFAVDGVLDVAVAVNETESVDALGLPPKTFRVVVEGGTDDDIAQAIWDNHAAGIGTSGAESGNAIDSNGTTKVMNFARPVVVDIFIEIVIATGPSFPSGGDELIKQAIVDFAAGLLPVPGCQDDENPELIPGITIGDDVEYSRLFTPINSVPGHTVTTFFLGTAASPTGVINIPISDLEKARFLLANIDVS